MKHALIIGNDQYIDPKLSRLKTPSEDSRELAKVLKDKHIGGFNEVKSLINQPARTIRKAISEFLLPKTPDDLVLVYFSGHGVLDDLGHLHFALKDTETSWLTATSIPSSFFSDEMSRCRSKRKIIILDCCHSGAFERGTKAGARKALTRSTFQGSGYGHVVLTASDSTQFALEGDTVLSQTEFSLFTHYLLEGLKTGEADKDNDGYISLDEWYEYTYSKVVSATPNQTPQKWAYRQQGELLIATNPNLKKTLPADLTQLLESRFPTIRAVAVVELSKLLKSPDTETAKLARTNLEKLKKDGDPTVSSTAKEALHSHKQPLRPVLKATPKREGNKPIGKIVPAEKIHRSPEKNRIVESSHSVQVLSPAVSQIASPTCDNKITLSNNAEFVHVPAGKFIMGSGHHNDNERPQHTVSISYEYWMGRFPVTNAQYNQFKKKSFVRGRENHPVVYVTWNSAQKYVTWLNENFASQLPSDYFFRLPSEAEWEKAARGEKGLIYPWGNEFDETKCNTREFGREDTSPVGFYSPQGDSPYDCADMAGNVWEWTCSLYMPYPFDTKNIIEKTSENDTVAVRGGSWRGTQGNARVSSRDSSRLNFEWPDYGFRVVIAPFSKFL